jgi:hypothetical protein
MAFFWVVAPCRLISLLTFQLSVLPPSSGWWLNHQCLHHPGDEGLITLMMEAVQTTEMFVNLYQSTRHYNPEDSHLCTHCLENLKSFFLCCFHFYIGWWMKSLQSFLLSHCLQFHASCSLSSWCPVVPCWTILFLITPFVAFFFLKFSVFLFSVLFECQIIVVVSLLILLTDIGFYLII